MKSSHFAYLELTEYSEAFTINVFLDEPDYPLSINWKDPNIECWDNESWIIEDFLPVLKKIKHFKEKKARKILRKDLTDDLTDQEIDLVITHQDALRSAFKYLKKFKKNFKFIDKSQ